MTLSLPGFLSVLMSIILAFATDADAKCGSNQMQCASSSHCVSTSHLCDGVSDCHDDSDEERNFCDVYYGRTRQCSRGHMKCSTYSGCNTWQNQCRNNGCARSVNSTMCDAVERRVIPNFKIDIPKPEPKVTLNDLEYFLNVVNASLESQSFGCPPFYANVSNTCYAFLPFKMTWPEALQMCESISGTLAELHDLTTFYNVVSYLQNKDVTSNFWVGGYYDITVADWRWESGNIMALGTPFWTMTYQSECSPRLMSDKSGQSEDCFRYHQAPTANAVGECSSLDYRNMFYFNNQPCTDLRKPICVYQPKK